MKKIVLSILMLFTVAGMAFAQADLQPLAVVKLNKSESITVKQLKTRVSLYERQVGTKLEPSDRKKILDTLIEEKLMIQAAAKANISIPDSNIDQYFATTLSQQLGSAQPMTEKAISDAIKQQLGISLDEFLVKQLGMNVSEYKTYLKNQLLIQQFVINSKPEVQKIAATDEEIRTFYDGNKASFVMNDSMQCFAVIVPKASDSDAAKNKVAELRNKFVDKKVTSDQMIVQSQIDGSGYQAGVTLIPKSEVAAQGIGLTYAQLAGYFDKGEGFTSDVVETPVDFRFFNVVKKYTAKMLGLSDEVQPGSGVIVYDYIRQNLSQQKQMAYLQSSAQELANSLNTSANVEMKKTGDDLLKLLNW